MCGIFCSVHPRSCDTDTEFTLSRQKLKDANALRGPDAQMSYYACDGDLSLEFFGSELRLRGNLPVVQPHIEDGDVLCWNGEIFGGMLEVKPDENDGVLLFQELKKRRSHADILDLFGNIEGPYAFVFFNARSRCIYFGRDPLGRRSLLIHKPTSYAPHLLLASVIAGVDSIHDFEEVLTDNIYCIDLTRPLNQCIQALPRRIAGGHFSSLNPINHELPPEDLPIAQSLDFIPPYLVDAVVNFIIALEDSVKRRVQNIPPTFLNSNARAGVLFSGGIDCTILAFLADKYIPQQEPIDLMNVAFENPRKIEAASQLSDSRKAKRRDKVPQVFDQVVSTASSFMVPDRVTGLQEVEELRRLCPNRIWNFIEVNVSYDESQSAIATIKELMHPNNTVMDLSLASALYFASRGIGHIQIGSESWEPYISHARVLLNGLGSDELLGGYGRHRTAFNRGGWQALVKELQLEITRLPSRNLGRDDRIISCHGKETRHPFLSLSFVDYVAQLPVHFKLDPRAELGMGDKYLLRLAARKLGLLEASERKKKAMQFGSHSARMHGEKKGDAMLG